VAERRVVDHRGEAAKRAVAAQAVDAALDRRRAERDLAADVAVGPAAVLHEQRNYVVVNSVDTANRCTNSIWSGIECIRPAP
jgi:hypothetical protein